MISIIPYVRNKLLIKGPIKGPIEWEEAWCQDVSVDIRFWAPLMVSKTSAHIQWALARGQNN